MSIGGPHEVLPPHGSSLNGVLVRLTCPQSLYPWDGKT